MIFLHWFHHTTVLAFTTHTFLEYNPSGIFFIAMNYLIHSIMYTYYFLMCVPGLRRVAGRFAQVITVGQILQMVVGTGISIGSAAFLHSVDGDKARCFIEPHSYKLALILYAAYLVLFVLMYIDKYHSKLRKDGAERLADGRICGANDAAGFFHPGQESKKKL